MLKKYGAAKMRILTVNSDGTYRLMPPLNGYGDCFVEIEG